MVSLIFCPSHTITDVTDLLGRGGSIDKKHNALFDAEVIRDIYNLIFE